MHKRCHDLGELSDGEVFIGKTSSSHDAASSLPLLP